MNNCPFCKFDKNDISNTFIEETDNFFILPSKGSLCEGYLLIVPKQHKFSINELNNAQKFELINLLEKYRKIFYKCYNNYPLFFEHGSSIQDQSNSSSSITHAHIHIVNHNFTNEKQIIKDLNMTKVSPEEFFNYKNQNYISYISPNSDFYITYNFKPISQQMRIFIANDLNLSNEYNWRTSNFENNIIKTIKALKTNIVD